MNSKLLLAIGLFAMIAKTQAGCNCGLGPGFDPCKSGGPSCVPLVVRPVPLPKIEIATLIKPKIIYKKVEGYTPFKPLGDLCTCGQTIVKPAIVPRPACASCSQGSTSQLSSQIQNSAQYGGYQGSLSSGTYQGGLSSVVYQGGPSSGGYQGGLSSGTYQGGLSSVVYRGGPASGGYQGGLYASKYQGDLSSGKYQSGYSSGTYQGSYQGGLSSSVVQSGASNGILQGGVLGGAALGSSCDQLQIQPIITPGLQTSYQPLSGSPAPADAVSLAIALRKQKAASISEDKLAYGFHKLPKEEIQVVLKKPVIPEENIYKVNGAILELKKATSTSTKTVDEEAEEDLLINDEIPEEDIADIGPIKQLTLGEIGYGLANIKPATFVSVPNQAAPLAPTVEVGGADSPNAPGLWSSGCGDGFQPGRVLIKAAPPVGVKLIPAAACDSGEVSEQKPASGQFYFGSAGSSQAASSNSYSSSYYGQL